MEITLTRAAYAKELSLSKSAITNAVKRGAIIVGPEGIDPKHPTNVLYERSIESKSRRSFTPSSTKRRGAPRVHLDKEPQKTNDTTNAERMAARRAARRAAAVIDKPEYDTKSELLDVEEIENPKKSKIKTLEDVNFEGDLGSIHDDLDVLKKVEMIREKEQKRLIAREELIPRLSVRRLLGRMYTIDVNELRPLGGSLGPVICAMCGVSDAEIVLSVSQKIENDIFQVLGHIKRELDDYLKRYGSDPLEDVDEEEEDLW